MTAELDAELEECMALMEAEDRAVGFLWKLPQDLAASTALHAAKQLLATWQKEKEELIRRRSRRKVFDIYREECAWLESLLAKAIPSDPVAEQRVIRLLSHLTPGCRGLSRVQDRPLFCGARRATAMTEPPAGRVASAHRPSDAAPLTAMEAHRAIAA